MNDPKQDYFFIILTFLIAVTLSLLPVPPASDIYARLLQTSIFLGRLMVKLAFRGRARQGTVSAKARAVVFCFAFASLDIHI